MGLAKLKTKISVEDYLQGEKISEVRYEYVNGEVYTMGGASDTHHRISANLFIKLDSHLANSKFEAFMAEMKLRANEKTFYYPDVFVSCDKIKKSKFYREEPILIIEVVSPSTRQTDRREKLRAYQQIPSVQEYVVVEQEKIHIELHRRQADNSWLTYIFDEDDRHEEIEFQPVDLKITLDEIYRRVDFIRKSDEFHQ